MVTLSLKALFEGLETYWNPSVANVLSSLRLLDLRLNVVYCFSICIFLFSDFAVYALGFRLSLLLEGVSRNIGEGLLLF